MNILRFLNNRVENQSPKVVGFSGLIILISFLSIYAGLLDQANESYKKTDFKKAIMLYKKAAFEGDNPALCYFNLGNSYFQIDSIAQSIVYYRAAIDYAPDFYRSHLNLAIAYYTLENSGKCIASAKRALQLNPMDEKASMLLAASYRKIGAIAEAIATFEKIISINDTKEEAYIALAEMYLELEDTVKALKWLKRYPENGKNQKYVLQQLADIYEKQSDYSKALFCFKEIFNMDSTNRWSIYRICLLHEKMGNDMVAIEEAQKGLRCFPDFMELALYAGNLAFKLEKLLDAEHYYTMARNMGSPGALSGLENVRIARAQKQSSISSETDSEKGNLILKKQIR